MIKNLSIDPNGLCNAKCWYCPIAYFGNPKIGRENMSIETLDKILKQIKEGVGDFVSNDLIVAYPTHYNEVLLHPEFEEIVKTYSKYNIQFVLFTNGVNLTPDKVDIINKYTDTVLRIVLNVPSAFKEEWSEFAGMNINLFDKLINNLKYAYNNLTNYLENGNYRIVVNGVNEKSYSKNGGWTNTLSNSKNYDLSLSNGTVEKTIKKFKNMFPKMLIDKNINLEDRIGILSNLNILSNKESIEIKNKKDKKNVIGCYDNRFEEWIHISATGDVFICCEDFNFETVFGNIHKQSIKEIWNSNERQEMIQKSMNTICRKCSYAKWGN